MSVLRLPVSVFGLLASFSGFRLRFPGLGRNFQAFGPHLVAKFEVLIIFGTHFRFDFRVCLEKGESTILLEKQI